MRYSLFGTIVSASAVIIALPFGVAGVSIAIALSSLYSLIVLHGGLRLIGLKMRHALAILAPPACAAAIMWVAIVLARPATTSAFVHPAPLLLVHIVTGAIVYAVCLHLISRKYLRDFTELGRRLLRRR